MNSASLSYSWRSISKNSRISGFFAALAISAAQLCRGDQTTISADPPQVEATISALNQKVNLGQYAQVDLPKGFRFVDADAARVLLERMNNPVSPGLVGILFPENNKWWAVLEFNEIGFVQGMDPKKGDSDAILKAVQARNDSENAQGAARILSVNWQIEPKYDADTHALEWAFQAEGKSGKVVNHTVALFGRRGVLNITTVQPYAALESQADSVSFNDVVKRITFKDGQRYADYQTSDKVSTGGLKELVMGNQPAPEVKPVGVAAPGSVPSPVYWSYVTVGACVALGVGLVVYGNLRKRKMQPAYYTNGHAVPAMQGNGANGNNGRHGSGRSKRMFNYQKFYSDMVLQLSGHSYSWVAPANGNSHPRAAAASPTPVASPTSPNQALANANLELIACQNNLIEEQRNLMREQARIIEEKAKLIKEYNQLMEKWSEDIENQFSLKLD
jgi:uncharacterized membrane-anchored protein